MKKTEIGLLSAVAVLAIILIITNFSKSEELTCLRMFKEIRDLEDSVDFQLAEYDTIKKRAELVVKYVDSSCPEFDQLGLRYNNSKQTLEQLNSDFQP